MPDANPAWTDDLLRDPHHVADKRSRVQRMFAAIAPRYDLNNRLHSFGLDQRWRRKAVELADLRRTDTVIDVACGTGDLAIAYARAMENAPNDWSRLGPQSPIDSLGPKTDRVIGIDFTFAMLPIARAKTPWLRAGFVLRHGLPPLLGDINRAGVQYFNADATALPLADASADVVSIAFGIRNVQEPAKAIAQFYRVLRPGGRVIILEFSQPKNRLIRWANDLYCAKIMPHTATLISGDKTGAYKYLPQSVATFMSREQMVAMLRDAGFVDVTQHPMTFGVCVCYRGYKR